MSKITQEKKALKGKQKKIAEADAKKTTKSKDEAPKQGKSNIPNLNKCCTCLHIFKEKHSLARSRALMLLASVMPVHLTSARLDN